MNCLKCGREISEEEVFCVDCRLEAQRYPVDPNTVVFIAKRDKNDAAKKSPRRRSVPLEEQVQILRRRLRLTVVLLLLAVCLIAGLSYPAFSYLTKDHYQKGQNYTPMTTVAPSTTEPEETIDLA